MSDNNIFRASAPDRPSPKGPDRLRAVTDEEIAAGVALDPDAPPLDLDWASAEAVVPPRKVPISIRVDEDVLDYFKKAGSGYQGRMNAVLRAYIQARSK